MIDRKINEIDKIQEDRYEMDKEIKKRNIYIYIYIYIYLFRKRYKKGS